MNLSWIKTALDLIISAMNYFPGWKTKVGAVLQVIGTLMLVWDNYLSALAGGFMFGTEVIVGVQAAAGTLVAVGAANQPANNTPSA